MNKQLVIFGVIIILLTVGLSGCTDIANADEIEVDSWDVIPSYYSADVFSDAELLVNVTVAVENGAYFQLTKYDEEMYGNDYNFVKEGETTTLRFSLGVEPGEYMLQAFGIDFTYKGDPEPVFSKTFKITDGQIWDDIDNDGVPDNIDAFPNDANETKDSDEDGVGDNRDEFSYDSAKSLNIEIIDCTLSISNCANCYSSGGHYQILENGRCDLNSISVKVKNNGNYPVNFDDSITGIYRRIIQDDNIEYYFDIENAPTIMPGNEEILNIVWMNWDSSKYIIDGEQAIIDLVHSNGNIEASYTTSVTMLGKSFYEDLLPTDLDDFKLKYVIVNNESYISALYTEITEYGTEGGSIYVDVLNIDNLIENEESKQIYFDELKETIENQDYGYIVFYSNGFLFILGAPSSYIRYLDLDEIRPLAESIDHYNLHDVNVIIEKEYKYANPELIANEITPKWSTYDSGRYWFKGCEIAFLSTYQNSISVKHYSLEIDGESRSTYFITPKKISPDGETTIELPLTGWNVFETGSYDLTVSFSGYTFTTTVNTPDEL